MAKKLMPIEWHENNLKNSLTYLNKRYEKALAELSYSIIALEELRKKSDVIEKAKQKNLSGLPIEG